MSSTIKPLKIYNASAGSGKTYTLVQAYLNIVLHNQDTFKFRSILAMTFTNKAANEMKERIIGALIDLNIENHFKSKSQLEFLNETAKNINLSPQLIETRSSQILNKILHNYSSFSVMTIDKFTHKVIRTFAKDLGISIDFNVEMDVKGFRKNITEMLVDQIGRNQKLTRLMLQYAHDNIEDDKTWNFTEQILQFSDLLLKEDAINAINLLKKLDDEDFVEIRSTLIEENAIIEKQLNRVAVEMNDLVKSNHLIESDFIGASRGLFSYFEKYIKGDYKLPTEKQIDKINDVNWANPKSPQKGIVENIGDLLSKYFLQIIELIETKVPQQKLNKTILKNLNNLSLLKHILELIDKVKEEENILLLSDFYKKIADIITKEPVPFIYERLGVRYQHFLLDEFQDTSELQWINLIPLVHNSLSQQHENLIVGDGKQAIYRWRNGEVEQFTKLPEKIHNPSQIESLKEAETLFAEMGEAIDLKSNYRSAKEIVQFNNHFFDQLSKKLDPELGYIYNNHDQKTTKSFDGYIESSLRADLTSDDQIDFTMKSVQKALDAGFSQKDICIITRRRSHGTEIASHLSKHNYKIISPESLYIGKDKTVKFLYFLMLSINNQNDRNARIKAIEHYCDLTEISSSFLISKERQNESVFSFFKKKSIVFLGPEDFHNLYDFTEHLIEAFNLDPSYNPYLQFFLENVHQYEIKKNASLSDFLKWFNEKGNENSIVSPEGADAINIMTIHKSKGLQYPVVICPFFDWKMDLQKQISWISNPTQQLPAYFVNITTDLEKSVLKEVYSTEKNKNILDNYNLLYVAFTRPEVALFISGKTYSGIAKNEILPFFKQSELFIEKNSIYTYGELLKPKDFKAKTSPNNIDIEYVKQKMNKPQLSYKSAQEWDIEELDQKRNFGTTIHQILAKINNHNETENIINKTCNKLGLKKDEIEKITNYITNLFSNKRFAEYFEYKSWNEKEIIDSNGQKLIPDKVIFNTGSIKVVDFKTGQESPKHKQQIKSYINVLKDLDYENITGEICYLESLEFQVIN